MPGDVYLCEVPMFRRPDRSDFRTEKKIDKPTNFKLKFDHYAQVDGRQYDRLYSRWVLAQKSQKGYLICSHGRYADDVKAQYDLPHEVVATKKRDRRFPRRSVRFRCGQPAGDQHYGQYMARFYALDSVRQFDSVRTQRQNLLCR